MRTYDQLMRILEERGLTSINTVKRKRILIAELFIDSYDHGGYQRTETSLVKKIIKHGFLPILASVIVVARRRKSGFGAGKYPVLDGGQRLRAAIELGMTYIECYLIDADITREDEGWIYVVLNRTRIPETWFDRYNSGINSGDTPSLTLKRILDASGYVMRDGIKAGSIFCVRQLYSMVQLDEESLVIAFPLAAEICGGLRIDFRIIYGLFYAIYAWKKSGIIESFDKPVVIEWLKSKPNDYIVKGIKEAIGKGSQNNPRHIASGLISHINTNVKGHKNKLSPIPSMVR
jgi:hypothetical protein